MNRMWLMFKFMNLYFLAYSLFFFSDCPFFLQSSLGTQQGSVRTNRWIRQHIILNDIIITISWNLAITKIKIQSTKYLYMCNGERQYIWTNSPSDVKVDFDIKCRRWLHWTGARKDKNLLKASAGFSSEACASVTERWAPNNNQQNREMQFSN